MTIISPDQDVMTLVNVFTVDPSNCVELVQLVRGLLRHVA